MSTSRSHIPAYVAITLLTVVEGHISVLIAPFLDSLGYTVAMVGIMVAVFSVVALLSRLPTGFLYTPTLVRPLMVGGILAFAATCVLYPLAVDPLAMAMVRALNGASFGVITTLLMALFMDSLPRDQPTRRPMSYYGAAMSAGYAVGNSVGGVLGDLLGYTLAYWSASALPLVSLALVWNMTRQVQPRPRTVEPGAEQLSRRARVLSTLRGFSQPQVVGVATAAFVLNFMLLLGLTFFPLYALSVGMSLTQIGLVRSAHSVAQIFSRLFTGEVAGRLGHRRLIVGTLVLLAGAHMLIPAFDSFAAALAIFLAIGALRAMAYVATTISVAEDIPQEKMSRGVASSVFNSSKDLGGLTGPLLGGFFATLLGIGGMFVIVPPIALGIYAAAQLAARHAAGQKPAAEAPAR